MSIIELLKAEAERIIKVMNDSFGWKVENSSIIDNIYVSDAVIYGDNVSIDSFSCYIPLYIDSVAELKEKEEPILGLGVHKNEGKIIIYSRSIEQYLVNIKSDERINVNSKVSLSETMYKLALWHSLSYWILHCMIDSNNERWDKEFWMCKPKFDVNALKEFGINSNIRYFEREKTKNKLEEMQRLVADIITLYITESDCEAGIRKPVYLDLLKGSKSNYEKLNNITDKGNFSWASTFKAIESVKHASYEKMKVFFNFSLEFWQLILDGKDTIGDNTVKQLMTGKEAELGMLYEKYKDQLKKIELIYY